MFFRHLETVKLIVASHAHPQHQFGKGTVAQCVPNRIGYSGAKSETARQSEPRNSWIQPSAVKTLLPEALERARACVTQEQIDQRTIKILLGFFISIVGGVAEDRHVIASGELCRIPRSPVGVGLFFP